MNEGVKHGGGNFAQHSSLPRTRCVLVVIYDHSHSEGEVVMVIIDE